MSDEDENETEKKGWNIFKTDFEAVPCFRSTFLVSISSGVATGLGFFLFTSKPRKAAHVGYGTFFVTTFAYWMYCRYKWSVEKFSYQQIMAGIKYQTLLEGTEEKENMGNLDKKGHSV